MLIEFVKYYNTFVLLNSTLRNHLALLARANGSLLLLSLSFLIQPLLPDGVFCRILERVERGVMVAAIALEAGCCLCVGSELNDVF